MVKKHDHLIGKKILAVDDEQDILESIEDILDEAVVDVAKDYETASAKIEKNRYDLVILDIMGVSGLVLLEEAVKKGLPAVMLTARAINPETLVSSIRKGAISFLPKETLVDLDDLLDELLGAYKEGKPPWKLLFEKLGDFFSDRFGPDWQDQDQPFWSEFSKTWDVGKGIQERLKTERNILDKGI